MNASTPSSSSPSPVPAPLTAPTRSRRALPPFVRPVLSCGGALLLGGVLVRLFSPAPAKTPLANTEGVGAPALMVLPRSQVMTARLSPLAPRTLRGDFHLTTDVTGRAPARGEVARQLVNVGSHVEAGDRVLEVSTGAVSRPVPVAEAQQDRAVREQSTAVKSQGALASQLSTAQNQLVIAQDRVTRAKERVASTSALVKRLLAGEQIPAAGDAAPAPRKRKRRTRRVVAPVSTRAQDRAEASLSEAKSALDSAQSERDDARKAVASAQKKVDFSQVALEKAEADFKAEKTTADVLQNARSDADDAAGALKSAQARADFADKALAASQSKVEVAHSLDQKAREQVNRAPAPEEAPKGEDDAPPAGRFLTADQAALMVASAVKESKAATRTADRMRARVNQYQRQVSSTSQQGEEASRDLQVAQKQVLDTAPRAIFTVARAPRSGTITWVSRFAREVSSGESVFGISQGRNGFLRFKDKGTAWKSLKVGQILNAAPAPAEPAPTEPAATDSASVSTPVATTAPKAAVTSSLTGASSGPTPTIGTAMGGSTTTGGASPGAVFSVRLTRIAPPQGDEDVAQIDAVVLDQGEMTAEVSAVQVQLPAEAVFPGGASIGLAASPARPVVVPASVVLPRDGVDYIAVMSPTSASTSNNQPVTLLWRPVQVARQTAFDVELRAGVRDGEEIVNQPALLLSQWKPEDKKPFSVLLDASG